MAIDFNSITEQDALKLLALAADPLTDFIVGDSSSTLAATVRKYISGDHWQDGDGWVGPSSDMAASTATNGGEIDQTMMALIEERFVSRNMVKDITKRHRNGVVGREPTWGFSPARGLADDEEPNDGEQAQIDTVEASMTPWWDRRRCHKLLQRSTTEILASSRAVLRLFVPAGRLVDVPQGPQLVADTASDPAAIAARGVAASSFDEALDQIYVDLIEAEDGGIFTDPDTMDKIGIVSYMRAGAAIGSAGTRVIELSYLDGDASMPRDERMTVIRLVGKGISDAPVRFALGGRLTHYAIEIEPMVTEQIISLQKALNLCLTCLARNVETNQFLERIFSNIQPPGYYEEDPTTGERTGKFILGTYTTGAGATNVVQGAEITDAAGNTTLATPGITFRPPSDASPSIESAEEFRAEILLEAKQGHILGSDIIASGISRQQARADFSTSLGDTAAVLNPAGQWLIETAAALAQAFANDPAIGDLAQLRAIFSCLLDSGPLDPTEVATATAGVKDGIVSREFGMIALGVEDTDAERALINSEPGKAIAIRTAKATALAAFVNAGLSMTAAAELAGFETDEIAIIKDDEMNTPIPAPAPANMIPKIDPLTGKPLIDPATGLPVLMPNPNPVPPPQNTLPANQNAA